MSLHYGRATRRRRLLMKLPMGAASRSAREIITKNAHGQERISSKGLSVSSNHARMVVRSPRPPDSMTSAGMARFSTAQKRPLRARHTHHRSAGEVDGRRERGWSRPDPLVEYWDSEIVPMLRTSLWLRPITGLLEAHPTACGLSPAICAARTHDVVWTIDSHTGPSSPRGRADELEPRISAGTDRC